MDGEVTTGLLSGVPILSAPDGGDAKAALNRFCSRMTGRPMLSKADISYAVNKFGDQFQAVCKLGCLGGQEVVGHLCGNIRDAEKSAAVMTLEAYKSQIDALPKEHPEETKRKMMTGGGFMQYSVGSAPKRQNTGLPCRFFAEGNCVKGPNCPFLHGTAPNPTYGGWLGGNGGTGMGSTSSNVGDGFGNGTAMETPGDASFSAKMKLNVLAMKIVKRALQQGEVVYETRPCAGGFQATVKIICLPSPWKGQLWAGEVSPHQMAAEQSAADVCLQTLTSEPSLVMLASGGMNSQPAGGAMFSPPSNGFVGSPMLSLSNNINSTPGASGPAMNLLNKMQGSGLPDPGNANNFGSNQVSGITKAGGRSRLREDFVYGEVVEWKGKFGWIKPAEDIQDENGRKYEKLFLLSTDVKKGVVLSEGSFIQFHVYQDSQGAGAYDVSLMM